MSRDCDVCSVGHVTRDRVRIGQQVREQPGGAAFYFPLALNRLGRSVSIVTKLAAADREFLLEELEEEKISVEWIDSPRSTTFDNIYSGKNLSDRTQRVECVADSFTVEDLALVRARFIHLGPLTAGEMSVDFIRAASARARICLDVQGLIRHLNRDRVEIRSWTDTEEGLGLVSILKANLEEATILSGETDPERAAMRLAKWVGGGDGEVIVTLGSLGAIICSGDQLCHIPALAASHVEDVTGCGDTFIAAYLHRRMQSESAEASGRFAAAAASLALAYFGPFRASQSDVDRARINERER